MIDVEPIYVAYIPLNKGYVQTIRMPFDQLGSFVNRMNGRMEGYEVSSDRRTAINRLCLNYGCLDQIALHELLSKRNENNMTRNYVEAEQLKHNHEDYKDTSNYHGAKGVYEPIYVMEYMAKEYVKRGIPAYTAMDLCLALKYLLRVGTKDGVEKELFKAENFIHRARTGEWMKTEKEARDSCLNEIDRPKQLDEDINGER